MDIKKELQDIETKQREASQRVFYILREYGKKIDSMEKYELEKICYNAAICWADRLDLAACSDFYLYLQGLHTNKRGQCTTYARKVARALQ